LSDRDLIGTLDAPPGAVTIAALSDRVEESGPLAITANSGSLLRTPGSGSSASIGTPFGASARARHAYNLKEDYNLKADCAPLHSWLRYANDVRALMAMLHLS
jgi:hypothetical protein